MSDSSSECCAREREARIGCWPPLGRGDALFRAQGVAPSSPSTAAGRVGAGGQVRLARKLHMWRTAFLVPATRPTPPYLVTCTTFGTSRVALEIISRWQYSNIHAIQLFSEMAASPGTELVSPASPPTSTSQTSHLKAYPYLFVRETDQVEDWIDSKTFVTTLSHP